MAAKSDLITKILTAADLAGAIRQQQRVILKKLTIAQLTEVLVKTQKKAAAAQQKQAGKQTGQAAKKKSRKSKALPKSLKTRAGKITRGIAAGKIPVKQGKAKPSDYTSGTSRQKYDKFIALYSGVRIPKKTAQQKGPSLADVYAAMEGAEGRSKWPYYLSRGYHVHAFNVGGGRGGAGIIRSIPGSGAKAFSKLNDAQQEKVATFLNTAKGQVLRSKGAPKTVSMAGMRQAKAQAVAKRKSRGKKAKQQQVAAVGSSSRGWGW